MITIAGLPSDAMYLIKLMRAELSLYELNRNRKMSTKAAANLFSRVLHGQFRTGFPFFVGMIVAGVDETGGHVFQLFVTNGFSAYEKGFIADTRSSWREGEVRFGFNIARMFSF